MQSHIHTLKNGLRIVLTNVPGNKTATVVVMTGTGSRYESAKENGLAHFLEHMFFKGTKKRPSAKAISEELDGVGAIYNAYTSKDRTAYYAKVGAEYIDSALDVITDIFLNSSLPSREITKERGAIIQEIDMYEDMPMRTVDNVFEELLFGAEHPLGRTILGPKANIRRFTREEFIAYHKRNYTPLNTIVSIAGDFDEKKTLAKLHKIFGKLDVGNPPDCITFSSEQDSARAAIKEKKTDQTQLMLGVPAYPYQHKDEYVLAVLATALGGGMSSRLFTEVREKRGLAYSVHAWVEKYPDTGYLAKVKVYLRGTLTLSLETSDEIAQDAASSLLTTQRIRPLAERLKAIDAVSAADVQRVAVDIFKSHLLNAAVIGPHANRKDLEALLKI
ncbi:MAG: Uncharacterized protein Athens041674_32 [Parcubacteria group bacterium Athens0416_74]|nr:MAG: Uncharacterized protein Athens041674_32 [Parcubacteria group bacterium Athens0416_74]